MNQTAPVAKFNLWNEPWISCVQTNGQTIKLSIDEVLRQAHNYQAVYEQSPLAVVGIHRLLVAILQAVIGPRLKSDLRTLWRSGCFPEQSIEEFGYQFSERFDLFSQDMPFMQSADLPLIPVKGDNSKTVAYLAAETSPSSGNGHYRHTLIQGDYFCPSCTAGSLLTIPPFISMGGRGYRPSINGIPPLYVLPMGRNLFESLALSLILPDESYWPKAASKGNDLPWWLHPVEIKKGAEVIEVGYLQSLTFPARQIRLHPLHLDGLCTRCGSPTKMGVQTMIFEMGESRARDSAYWVDPFVPYRIPDEGKSGSPYAIRPDKGRVLWREYSGLFLSPAKEGRKRVHRPAILSRIAEEFDEFDLQFRCTGVLMDQAKVLEWVDARFQVPLSLMKDPAAPYLVQDAVWFSEECAVIIGDQFRFAVNSSRKGNRFKTLKDLMLADFWGELSGSFQEFVSSLIDPISRTSSREEWSKAVLRVAKQVFEGAIAQIGDDAESLREQEEAKQMCRILLAKKQQKYLHKGVKP